jgi:hypothetical protein
VAREREPLDVLNDVLRGVGSASEGREAIEALRFEREVIMASQAVDLAPGALPDFLHRATAIFGPGKKRPADPHDPTRELDVETWARVHLRTACPHLFRR